MATDTIRISAEGIEAVPFEIPGATGEFRIQVLNEDAGRGVVTTIVHLPAGGTIPAHFHEAGSEMHYVLDGDLIENGESLGAGAFLTHAARQVHGPHESRNGARVLTVQYWQSSGGSFDFHPAEQGSATGATSGASAGGGAPASGDAATGDKGAAAATTGGGYGGDTTPSEGAGSAAKDSAMDADRDRANDAPPPGLPDQDAQAGERGEAKGYA